MFFRLDKFSVFRDVRKIFYFKYENSDFIRLYFFFN